MSNIPLRIQRLRVKGFNLKEYSKSINGLECVYVGRGSRWGNPFRVVKYWNNRWGIKIDGSAKCEEILINNCHFDYETREEAIKEAIKCYGFWLLPYIHKESSMMGFFQSIAKNKDAIISLKGKNLSCWCKVVDENNVYHHCHADFLLSIANGIDNNEIIKNNMESFRLF